MLQRKFIAAALTLLPVIGTAAISEADCIRSCQAYVHTRLTYQPQGQSHTERKTELLQTTDNLSREGRAGNSCLPHNIFKAKTRACSEAARDLAAMHRSGQKQMQAVCQAVQYSESLIPRSNVQNQIFPKADWYRIDQMETKAHRDRVRMRAEIDDIDRQRFACTDGQPVVLQAGVRRTTTDSAAHSPSPPPAPVAPPPSPGQVSEAAPPPPPTLANGSRADLFISEFDISPAEPVKGQPLTVRVGVYNRGSIPSGPFTVQWWPGENYGEPACSWSIDRLSARGGRIVTCRYAGYPSWYTRINSKVAADTEGTVAETTESNNVRTKQIRVDKR